MGPRGLDIDLITRQEHMAVVAPRNDGVLNTTAGGHFEAICDRVMACDVRRSS
jgi:hypothetical protein